MKKKLIIVTGGGRGIGRAITERLLKEGYAVHICGKDSVRLKRAESELSRLGAVSSTLLDISDKAAVAEFSGSWKRPLYGIVNNAGVCITERLE